MACPIQSHGATYNFWENFTRFWHQFSCWQRTIQLVNCVTANFITTIERHNWFYFIHVIRNTVRYDKVAGPVTFYLIRNDPMIYKLKNTSSFMQLNLLRSFIPTSSFHTTLLSASRIKAICWCCNRYTIAVSK